MPERRPLAATFERVVASLPDDWTNLQLDLRIDDLDRYIETATWLVPANAQPYSRHDWHWRLLVAHRFGHAAAVPAVLGCLRALDEVGVTGELAVREVRAGRAEVEPMWGRGDSVRAAFRTLRAH